MSSFSRIITWLLVTIFIICCPQLRIVALLCYYSRVDAVAAGDPGSQVGREVGAWSHHTEGGGGETEASRKTHQVENRSHKDKSSQLGSLKLKTVLFPADLSD